MPKKSANATKQASPAHSSYALASTGHPSRPDPTALALSALPRPLWPHCRPPHGTAACWDVSWYSWGARRGAPPGPRPQDTELSAAETRYRSSDRGPQRRGSSPHQRDPGERLGAGWGGAELAWAGLQPVPCPLRRKARLQGKHRRGISQGTEDREGGRERLRCPVAGGEREGVGGGGVEWKGT